MTDQFDAILGNFFVMLYSIFVKVAMAVSDMLDPFAM